MDIGTAKPDADELQAAPHRLLDIRDPSQAYSAADFRRDALAEMADITAAGVSRCWWAAQCYISKPCLKGCRRYRRRTRKSGPELSSRRQSRVGTRYTDSFRTSIRWLRRVFIQMIRKDFPGHWKFFISGKTLTELTQTSGDALPYQVHQFAIAPASRELLHQRIEQRFHQMLASGFEAEVRALLPVEICIRICLPFVV